MKNLTVTRGVWGLILLLTLGLYSVLSKAGETFPSKPVTLIVPFAPGGTLDVFSRNLGQALSKSWGQSVIVENKPGSSEMLGVQRLLSAPPDGHTILVAGALSFTLNQLTFEELSYDPDKLEPVTRMFNVNLAWIVPEENAPDSFSDFVEQSKQKGNFMFGSAGGVGGQLHLAYLDVVSESGAVLDFVPYNGIAPTLQDLLGGRVNAVLAGVAPPVGAHIESGRVKALAVGGQSRSKRFPDIPTFREIGYPQVNASFYTGLAVPSGTPKAIVERIAADVRTVLMDPEFAQLNLDPHGIEVIADTPNEFATYLVKDLDIKRKTLKDAGLLKKTSGQ